MAVNGERWRVRGQLQSRHMLKLRVTHSKFRLFPLGIIYNYIYMYISAYIKYTIFIHFIMTCRFLGFNRHPSCASYPWISSAFRMGKSNFSLRPISAGFRIEMEHLRIKYGSNKNNMVKSMVIYIIWIWFLKKNVTSTIYPTLSGYLIRWVGATLIL